MFFRKKITQKQNTASKVRSNDVILDDRLYEFTKKVKKMSKDEVLVNLLARQLSRLIK